MSVCASTLTTRAKPRHRPSDYAFLVAEDGGVITYAGNGAGAMNAAGPGGLSAQVSYLAGSETWAAELRIAKAQLGDWNHLVGMSAGHYNLTGPSDDHTWPSLPIAAGEADPVNWGTTALGLLPIISSVTPFSATVGSGALQIVIEGDYIAANPVVLYNGTPYTPTTDALVVAADVNGDGAVDAAEASEALAVSASSVLTIEIPAANVGAAGAKSLVVRNPGPFDSPAAGININNLQPTVTSLAPAGKTAGDPSFVLTVNGSNFASGAVVYWDGAPLPTTFMAANKLTAQVDASLMTLGKSVGISVGNPLPALADSNAAAFTVTADAELQWLPIVNK